jgi:hypothetical protein
MYGSTESVYRSACHVYLASIKESTLISGVLCDERVAL